MLLAALVLGLWACGGDDSADEETAAGPTAEPAAPAAPADVPALAEGVSKDTGSKPQIAAPQGEPPAELVSEDIVRGKGPAAKGGDQVRVHYVGVSWSTGQEFDASWDRGEPFAFPLGAGRVIPGWDEGVQGMRRGGRRLLVIPPDLGYGATGQPPAIGPNETLIFVVDALRTG
jgi:peptidylprolyl isomerase